MIPFLIGFLIGSWVTEKILERAGDELAIALDQIEAYANKEQE